MYKIIRQPRSHPSLFPPFTPTQSLLYIQCCVYFMCMVFQFHEKLSVSIHNLYSVIFFFLGPHLWHMEFPGLGIKLEVQLPAYTTAIAVPYLSHVCDLLNSLWHCWILNPLSKAMDRTCSLMDTSQVLSPLSQHRNSTTCIL